MSAQKIEFEPEEVSDEPVTYYEIRWFPHPKDWAWGLETPSKLFDISASLTLESIRRLGPLEIRKLVKKPAVLDFDNKWWRSPLEKVEGHEVIVINSRPIPEAKIVQLVGDYSMHWHDRELEEADALKQRLADHGVHVEMRDSGAVWWRTR